MSRKSLLALLLVGALGFVMMRGTAAAQFPAVPDVPPPPPPAPMIDPLNQTPVPQPDVEQPRIHTTTIYNGDCVVRKTFLWQNGAWHSCPDGHAYDVFFRDCPGSAWHYYGTFCSPHRAEQVACSLRANGNLAAIRQHCS
jgi:hypothetical protein